MHQEQLEFQGQQLFSKIIKVKPNDFILSLLIVDKETARILCLSEITNKETLLHLLKRSLESLEEF